MNNVQNHAGEIKEEFKVQDRLMNVNMIEY